ncbi:hypothetical protein AHAS_Ahas08G0054700 [Arachis hypogaea]
MECSKQNGQITHHGCATQKESYHHALANHEVRFADRVQIWRDALKEAANLSGFHSPSSSFRYFLAEIEGPEQKSDSETKKDCRCCWILTSLHSKWIFWSYRSPIGALSTALESRHLGLSSNI